MKISRAEFPSVLLCGKILHFAGCSSTFAPSHSFLCSFRHPTLAGGEVELISCSAEHAAGTTQNAIVIKYCNSGNLISHVLIETVSQPVSH